MLIPFRLALATERSTRSRSEDEQRILSSILNFRLSATEARAVWPQIEEHKWYVSEQLGRDVGLRVAALDYFENIHGLRTQASRTNAVTRRLRSGAKDFATLYLTHQNLKAFDGVWGASPEEFSWPRGGMAASR
jgi:hypothetical protein